MAWFKRGAKDKEKEAEEKAAQEQESENGAEAEAAPAQPPAAQATYRTGRLAGVYLRMYRWVFSVSLNFDSYQLESGVGRFAAGDFPLRGYYNQLFSLFHGQITEEQRELFNDTFSAKALSVALSGGRSVLSELFYANFDRAEEEHTVSEEESPWRWYEFRAERIPDADPQRVQFLLYVRNAAGEGDDGRLPKEAQIPLNQDGSYDWGDIRANRLLNSNDMISYEYDVGQDKLFVHRRRGDKQIDQAEDRFLATLEAKSDWMVFHDSVSDVHTLFKNAMSGLSGSKEIRYRKDGMQGANFVHYKMSAYPLEETGKPTWVFGDLRDVEEQVRQREQDKDILVQMDALLNELYTSMFQVDTNRMVVYRISRTETGFSRSKEAQNLEEKLQGQIRRGVIAPESAKDYLNWLRPGYLQSKTMSGSYEFEARLRLPGTTEYRWYSETITPMDGRPGVFMRLRRDVTETRQLRMTRFEMEQKTRLAEYNGSVLDTMASLVEFRNVETGSHISNVRELTRIFLTDIAMRSPNYEISAHMIDLYAQAATIHDIGKISISD
ncbi:MAG: hypothetical protein IKN53_06450, partial [Oscillibacter sp.]|nr:hypothetical protein [Oscillibacter sp.]